ncbi:MAG: DUF3800 domain-containing protein [Bryobacteraceae bacterium]
MVEAYFDESGTDRSAGIMCIAGYIMTTEQARRLDAEWLGILTKYRLPYFHMASCAHGVGVFDGRPKQERIEIETAMIGIIKRRVERGLIAIISEEEYLRIVPADVRVLSGSAYSWCLKCALRGVQAWLQKYSIKDPVSYFFESGHSFQSEADVILRSTFAVPDIRSRYNYVSHTFATKIPHPPDNPCVRPLQAADLLAWQARKWKSDIGKRYPRADFVSLMETPHFTLDATTERLEQMATLKIVPDHLLKHVEEKSPRDLIEEAEKKHVKPLPPPPVPGNTEWERFDNAVGMLLSAPRGAFVKQEKKLKKRREKKRAAKHPN